MIVNVYFSFISVQKFLCKASTSGYLDTFEQNFNDFKNILATTKWKNTIIKQNRIVWFPP